jgi:hypothetical protein
MAMGGATQMGPSPTLPQWSLAIFVRYLVRIILFPLMPLYLLPKLVVELVVWLYKRICGLIPATDVWRDPHRWRYLGLLWRFFAPYSSKYRSFYLTLRDGVRVAVDVWLPYNAGSEKVSCVFHQARYYR